ncbi:MAG TPA: hypothetical protein VHC47_03595, partial [Mucilaginibacter sp.]|nr:hypothetical protein [Mucilaginibacter sp.]
MKLLARYNRVTLLTTIIVMIITGIIYYGAINLILTRIVDKDLLVEENEIYDYVNLNHKLPQVFESNDQQISFSEAQPGSVKREFINTLYLKTKHHRHHIQREYESGRGLVTSVIAGGKYYR